MALRLASMASLCAQIERGSMKSRCCERCFQDLVLLEIVREEGRKGDCPWCGATEVKAVSLDKLTEVFETFVESYARGTGELLGDILAEWGIFGEALDKDSKTRQALVVAILEQGLPADPKDLVDYPDYDDLFTPRWERSWDLEEVWEHIILELFRRERTPGWKNTLRRLLRRALGKPPALKWPGNDQLELAIEDLGVEYNADAQLFRARCHKESGPAERYALQDLSAPPPKMTPVGRANRKGQPALYMASDPSTAVAEVRPWKHAAVAVATMRLAKDARILDLTDLTPLGSPFGLSNLSWAVEARGLLARFAEELSRPVSPHDEAGDYIASQSICDAVGRLKFQGIAYPSAVADGKNIVLFDTSAAAPQSLRYVRVMTVSYSFSEMSQTDPIKESPWI
jgi:RES domain-containing protein